MPSRYYRIKLMKLSPSRIPSPFGRRTRATLHRSRQRTPQTCGNSDVHAFAILPNHIHEIVALAHSVVLRSAHACAPASVTKYASTRNRMPSRYYRIIFMKLSPSRIPASFGRRMRAPLHRSRQRTPKIWGNSDAHAFAILPNQIHEIVALAHSVAVRATHACAPASVTATDAANMRQFGCACLRDTTESYS
jgi:hypothetical protein